MIIELNKQSFFVFDLDDTLYPEIDYLKSAYMTIARQLQPMIGNDIYPQMIMHYNQKKDVFQWIVDTYPSRITKEELLKIYREHTPDISLSTDSKYLLDYLKESAIPMGLITDGRSISQRNKLKALKIEDYFCDIIISEEFGSQKPDSRNFRFFSDKYAESKFYFFGDNLKKDFIVPLQLGWDVFCLIDKGHNVHRQDRSMSSNLISFINSFSDINLYLTNNGE